MKRGFTLIELLVVMAVIGLMLSIVAPRFGAQVDRARENVLRHNLTGIRDALERFRTDRGRAPASLEELVGERYLREVPVDPMTERRDSWVLMRSTAGEGGILDVRSSANGNSSNGSAYVTW